MRSIWPVFPSLRSVYGFGLQFKVEVVVKHAELEGKRSEVWGTNVDNKGPPYCINANMCVAACACVFPA